MAVTIEANDSSGPTITANQQRLVPLLFSEPVIAPTTRIYRFQEPTFAAYFLYPLERDLPILSLAQDSHDFAQNRHELQPWAPLVYSHFNGHNLPEELVYFMAQIIWGNIPERERPQAIAGIPGAGDKWAEILSQISGIKRVDLFKKNVGRPKPGTPIEVSPDRRRNFTPREIVALEDAPLGAGNRLLVVDDTIAQTATKNAATEVAIQRDWVVSGIAVAYDRQERGPRTLPGIPVYSALSFDKAFYLAHEYKLISGIEYRLASTCKNLASRADVGRPSGVVPIYTEYITDPAEIPTYLDQIRAIVEAKRK